MASTCASKLALTAWWYSKRTEHTRYLEARRSSNIAVLVEGVMISRHSRKLTAIMGYRA